MGIIKHEISGNRGSFLYEIDGRKLAEKVYSMAGDRRMIIEHIEGDASLKGQSIGKKLLAVLVEFARSNQIKVIPLCPFANNTFQETKEWQDVLSNIKVKHIK